MPKYHQIDSSMIYGDPLDHLVKIKFHTDKISSALISTIDEISENILQNVSKKYPRWKANEVLNKSNRGSDGYIVDFGYQNEAAKELNKMTAGQKAQPILGLYTLDVKAHKRRVKGKRGRERIIHVKAHTKEYVGFKPVKINDNWRIVNKLPERSAKHPLKKATSIYIKPNKFVEIFKKHLQDNYRNSRIS
tara:strand:- start:14 stop:586 length:573 start_codon:yes stop_codon:yes gene_type:complete